MLEPLCLLAGDCRRAGLIDGVVILSLTRDGVICLEFVLLHCTSGRSVKTALLLPLQYSFTKAAPCPGNTYCLFSLIFQIVELARVRDVCNMFNSETAPGSTCKILSEEYSLAAVGRQKCSAGSLCRPRANFNWNSLPVRQSAVEACRSCCGAAMQSAH